MCVWEGGEQGLLFGVVALKRGGGMICRFGGFVLVVGFDLLVGDLDS